MSEVAKYQKLDALIMGRISHRPTRFGAIYAGQVEAECVRIAREAGALKFGAARVLDRRLQAMRKGGAILATSMGWVQAGEV